VTDDVTNDSVIDAIYAHARRGAGADLARTARARPAVACILWRATGAGQVELYAAQRAASLAFLGGFWTFPGGAVEPDDAGPTATAAREIDEELGIALPADSAAYVDAGRWVTPEFAPIRFDTTYYLVELPAGAEPDWRASGGELEDGAWVAPGELLDRWRAGDWLVPTPVLRAVGALEPGLDGAAERCRAAAEAENAAPRVWDLVPGVALVPLRTPTLPPATHTNCFLFGTGEVVAVDPASPYPDEQAALDRAIDALADSGRRLVEIWLTHHHLDHVSGAAALAERAGVPIAAHPETAARLAGRVPVSRELADGDTRELAGPVPRRLRALFTPGHAPGHLCYLEEETGFLAAGDMVAGVGTILVDPSEGDMARYLDSLRLLRRLEPRVLLPAHGHAISAVASKLDGYIRHRLWREERVAGALAARGPATPADLVPAAYADVPEALYPMAERSLIAHLVKLEADGVAARDGGLWRPCQ
jgi:glyoxylase-like metal-dependent hydrolase (beta-lactamase superfamily II)/8-oxo-dGTP pyrophosphatase MutT (NUDIX family)